MTYRDALIAMVYVHPCQCGDGIPAGQCARCRAVKLLGFDPAKGIDEPPLRKHKGTDEPGVVPRLNPASVGSV